MIQTFAPAKLNLYLHVTGKRPDGYHQLDSLVAFCDVGDALYIEEADTFSFAVEGPLSAGLQNEPMDGNLVVRAARALAELSGKPLAMKITLVKNLPVASGIGGGSSDAAAALRALAEFWGLNAEDPALYTIAKKLGADVPCCISAKTCYFRDTGTEMDAGPDLPEVDLVLVNPRKALPTAGVFKARTGAFSAEDRLDQTPKNAAELAALLQTRHNDLYPPACVVLPLVRDVMAEISGSKSCLLARMSGSGATCFGLYPDEASAEKAVLDIQSRRPEWWVVRSKLPQKSLKC